jgi:dihydropteroate synthase
MNKIYIDPGFGFGKSTEHNKTMLANLTEFNKIGAKILVGISRKSMLGDILKKDVSQRIAGGLATTVLAYLQGANIIRTHDVAETKDALVLASAVMANLQEKK